MVGQGRKPGASRRKVTVKELAAHAGVSRATVSLVLRDSPLVRASTRARVKAAITELGYVYDRNAARMRAKLSHTVGVIVVDLTSPFYAELLAGIDAELDRAGFLGFLSNTGEDPVRQARVMDRFRENAVDGIILCPAAGADAGLIRRVLSWRLPLVQALRRLDEVPCDFVGTDNRRGMRLATEHLIAQGHRHIAFIGGAADTSVARNRRGGYRDAMDAHGLPPREWLCPSTKADAAAATRQAMAAPDRPTAVVCFNDSVAFGVMFSLREIGIEPGRDIAVVGFDDVADATLSVPSLSSVAIAPAAIGSAAADLLLARIAYPDGVPEQRVLEPRLHVRQTSNRPFPSRNRESGLCPEQPA